MLRRDKRLLLSLLATLFFSFSSLLIAQDSQESDQAQAYTQSGASQETQDSGSHARIVRLSYVKGEVQIDNDHGFQNATMNIPVTEGNRLVTSSDSWAEVEFEDGGTLRLAPETQVTFSELGRNSSGGTLTAVDLDEGEAELRLHKKEGSEFAVTARNKTILLRHSGRFRVTTSNSIPLQVAVLKGEVSVRDNSSDSEVAVKKNETFALNTSDFERYRLEKGAEADALDRWGDERDEALAAYNARGTGYAESPYQYGVSDLNYYGQYYDMPGYGYLWQPYGVNFGWNPYMNGYWCYSPFYGYTWVSAYPWGWMPYRYGHWIFINGRGWMWQPGAWGNWHRRPFLINPPAGFRAPAPPTVVGNRPGGPNRVGPRPGGGPGSSPAISTRQQDGRPHRVFSNIDVDRTRRGGEPAASSTPGSTAPSSSTPPSSTPASSTPAARGNVVVERKEVERKENAPQSQQPGDSERRGRESRGEQPSVNTVTPRAQEPAASRPPAAPVIHAEPAPSHVPAPAPHVSAPEPSRAPEAPRMSPPPAPRAEPPPSSRPPESVSRPK
jgi:hypothetical protein